MAEGLLGGILGEEDEKPEVEASENIAGADAFAAAVAARLAGNDPGVARKTEIFLEKHAQLLELQAANLRSEHASRLHFLQGQAREVDIRRLGLKLRVGFQLILALLATAVAVGLIIMVRDAITSRSVVIEPIDVAPNLSNQVPSGKILAASVLDVLTNIQAANHSGAERRALSNGWTSEISIEVPETGISFSQLERILKTRFGHDQHIDGDLVQGEHGGLALTVRGTGIRPRTFSDDGHNLEKLLLDAGEYVYGQSQPGLWTSYLANNDRADDAIRFAQSAYSTVDPGERPYVLNYWAGAVSAKGGPGAMAEALSLWRETIRLKPDYYTGYNNIMFALDGLGEEEALVHVGEQLMKVAGGRPGRAPEEMYQNYDEIVRDLKAQRAEGLAELALHSGIGTTSTPTGSENLNMAFVEAQMHDDEGAAFTLKTTSLDEHNLPDVAVAAMDRAQISEQRGDHKAAAEAWDVFTRIYKSSIEYSTNSKPTICYSAVTYELVGESAKADAALDAVGDVHFVDCYRFRGDVLELRGDWAGAQDWYAKSVQLGPSIPSGYYSWGVALAKHGDLAGAVARFKEANQHGPHWADPLKAWGDILAKQGLRKDALTKYDEAIKYAPNWKQLKQARDAVALQKT
jgi:tetratricopeptide (TPR) repeat protein